MADARPKVSLGNAMLAEVEHGRLELLVGARPVDLVASKSFGSVKICRPPIVAVMMTKIRVGRMLGIVIEKKRRTAPAPSSAADS